MICDNCGNPLYAEDVFCSCCGANRNRTAVVAKAKRKLAVYKTILCIAIVAALVAAAGLTTWYTGYEYAVQKFFKCIEHQDGPRLYESVELECWKEYYDHYMGDGKALVNRQQYVKTINDEYTEEYGSDFRIRYEVTEKQRITGTERTELQEELVDQYGYDQSSREKIQISDAYELKVTAHVSGSKGSGDHEWELTVVRENGKWRLL
jgi:hypothetical protein